MNKLLSLFIASTFVISNLYSQCDTDFDWGDQEYGVSPDPDEGETFADGFIDTAYSDTIHILVPTDSSVLLEGSELAIDSVKLENIEIVQGDVVYTPEEFGLALSCNNNGAALDPCTFIGGQEGCGVIAGTPLVGGGTFEVTINATIFVTLFGVQEFPFTYSGYTLLIDDGTSITEPKEPVADLKVTPNPFSSNALVQYYAANSGLANFKIYSLLGEEKYSENLKVTQGHNKIKLSAEGLESGVYLYHIEIGEFRVTKRLVINK